MAKGKTMQTVQLSDSTIKKIEKEAIKKDRTPHYLRVKAIEEKFGK